MRPAQGVKGKASMDFIDYLREKLPLVDEALARAAAGPMAEGATTAGAGCEPDSRDSAPHQPTADLERYLYAPLAHFTAGGGKRVRPVLCLLGSEAVGGDPRVALAPAAAVELFQSAALIHDDIADESELRRGEPCLYRTEGVGVATNMGDLALTQVYEVVLADDTLPEGRKPAVLRELVRMERHTLEGQALDLGWARDGRWDVTPEDYLYMVESKTAWYTCACPLYLGAIAAGARPDVAAGLLGVGRHAGIAFQLQDDLLNLVGDADAQGKDFRSDITEGKRTLAAVHALAALDDARRTELVGLLESGTTDPERLAHAVELIELGGGIGRCRQLAERECAAAKDGVRALADAGVVKAEAAELICSMGDFFVRRDH